MPRCQKCRRKRGLRAPLEPLVFTSTTPGWSRRHYGMVWQTQSRITRAYCPRCTEEAVRESHRYRRATEEDLVRIGVEGTCESGDEYKPEAHATSGDVADEAGAGAGAGAGKTEAEDNRTPPLYPVPPHRFFDPAPGFFVIKDYVNPATFRVRLAPATSSASSGEGFVFHDRDFYTQTAEGRAYLREALHGPNAFTAARGSFAARIRDLFDADAEPAPAPTDTDPDPAPDVPAADPAPADADERIHAGVGCAHLTAPPPP